MCTGALPIDDVSFFLIYVIKCDKICISVFLNAGRPIDQHQSNEISTSWHCCLLHFWKCQLVLVLKTCSSEYSKWLPPGAVIDRLSHSFRVHQIRFRLRRGPRWGSLKRSTRPSSWFKEHLLLRVRGERGKESEGRGRPSPARTQIPGSAHES